MSTNSGESRPGYVKLGVSKERYEAALEHKRKKTEAEKAEKSKEPSGPRWGMAAWDAAREAYRNGTYQEELLPIIISSTGMFASPQRLQTFLDLPSTPEMRWGSKATWWQDEMPNDPPEEDKLQFCGVNRTNYHRVRNNTEGKSVLTWVPEGIRRDGYLATSKKEGAQ